MFRRSTRTTPPSSFFSSWKGRVKNSRKLSKTWKSCRWWLSHSGFTMPFTSPHEGNCAFLLTPKRPSTAGKKRSSQSSDAIISKTARGKGCSKFSHTFHSQGMLPKPSSLRAPHSARGVVVSSLQQKGRNVQRVDACARRKSCVAGLLSVFAFKRIKGAPRLSSSEIRHEAPKGVPKNNSLAIASPDRFFCAGTSLRQVGDSA